MYIDHIEIEQFRTFRKTRIDFCHADQDFASLGIPTPKLKNLNLLLANNGYGKSSLLKAICLAALGPAVGDSGIFPYHLVRREAGVSGVDQATLKAQFTTHKQDDVPESISAIASTIHVAREGDLELLRWGSGDAKSWHPVFSQNSDAMFVLGYGASRRVAKSTRMEQSGRRSARAARVMGLFEEDYSLRPLNTWLPRYKESRQLKGRYKQVVDLLNDLIGVDWRFTGVQDADGEYLYGDKGVSVPFPALSDGYRAILGWLGDLMYHVCETCPSGEKLTDNKGIVMVDEIDLHLHPKWQMSVLSSLARALPNVQFIVTSHSPLVVGSIEWMNILLMRPGTNQSSRIVRHDSAVQGLDADQILLSEFFGLKSTRAPGKNRQLKALSLRAGAGDTDAAEELLRQMSKGSEASR